MNRLKTELLGGFPLEGDDLRFEDESYRNSLQALCRGFGYDWVRLWGVEATTNAGVVNVSEGYIYYEGEIRYVPAASFSEVAGNVLFIGVNEFDDPTSIETFNDGSQKATKEIRQAKIVYSNVQGSNVFYVLFKDLITIIGDALGLNTTSTFEKNKYVLPAASSSMTWNGNEWEYSFAHGIANFNHANVVNLQVVTIGDGGQLPAGVAYSDTVYEGELIVTINNTNVVIYLDLQQNNPGIPYLIWENCLKNVLIEYNV